MRLVDADAAIEQFKDMFSIGDDRAALPLGVIRALVIKTLESMIEAEPVKGAWEIAIGYDPRRAFMCDQCHKMAFEPSLYCPNCGAKMEVEE